MDILGETEHLSSNSEILIFIALVEITKTVKYYEYCCKELGGLWDESNI